MSLVHPAIPEGLASDKTAAQKTSLKTAIMQADEIYELKHERRQILTKLEEFIKAAEAIVGVCDCTIDEDSKTKRRYYDRRDEAKTWLERYPERLEMPEEIE